MTSLRLSVFLAAMLLIACGDGAAPPGVPQAGFGGGSGDSGLPDGALPDGALPDGGVPDGGDAGLTGDLCTDHLSGISCQVEEIVATPGTFATRVCARFQDGSVRCKDYRGDAEAPAVPPFIPLTAPAIELVARRGAGNCALLSDGEVQCWEFDDGRDLRSVSFGQGEVEHLAEGGALEVEGEPGFCALVDGQVRCTDALMCMPGQNGVVCVRLTDVVTLDLGSRRFIKLAGECAVTEDNELVCWGGGPNGQDETVEVAPSPSLAPIDFGEDVIGVTRSTYEWSTLGAGSACAILRDGDLRCWGSNYYGELGHDYPVRTTQSEQFIISMDQPMARQVSSQGRVVCIVTVGGEVRCWGTNTRGELGVEDHQQRGGLVGAPDFYRPYSDVRSVDLGTGRSALQVRAGTCALLDDHSVKCWGRRIGDEPGEMGDNLPRIDFGSRSRADEEGFPPIVSVVAPLGSSDPMDATFGESVEVTCDVQPDPMSADAVDPNSVTIRIVNSADPTTIPLEASATLDTGTRYVGTLEGLNTLPTGSYVIECTAADNATEPRVGRASIAVLYDGGPDVTVLSPAMDGAIVGQRALLHVEIEALPAPLAATDPDAEVATVEVTLGGVPVPVTEGMTEGRYVADVDLLSPSFEPPPAGPVLLSVVATSVRGRSHVVTRELVVDDAGPVITVTGMTMDGTLVRGVLTIRLQVVDALAGTSPSSVRGHVANSPNPLVFTFVTDHYEALIETLQYGSHATQLPIVITATDLVGNASDLPLTLRLDNAPPTVSLDPPDIRETKRGTGARLVCSSPFDPLGSDSVDDQQIAPEGAEFRARIEDQNPLSGNGVVSIIAGVDPSEVAVYLMADQSRPMLIDTDGDGVCDELNDEAPVFQRDLAPVMPAGRSYFPASAAVDGLEPAWDDSVCGAGTETAAPPRLCTSTSPLTRTIKASVPGTPVASVWGLPAVDALNCAGRSWDWRNDLPNGGPVCAAVRAVDQLGNVGVSVPIRLCLQRSTGSVFDCNADLSWQNHDCLSGTYGQQQVSCTPPPDFQAGYVRAD